VDVIGRLTVTPVDATVDDDARAHREREPRRDATR